MLFRTPYNASSLSIIDNISIELLPYVVDPGLAVVLQVRPTDDARRFAWCLSYLSTEKCELII